VSRVRLFFVYAPGCHVCEDAEAAVRAFASANRAVAVFTMDITRAAWPEWIPKRYTPQATPTYYLHQPEEKRRVTIHEGTISPDGVERAPAIQKWVNSLLPPGRARDEVLEAQWHPWQKALPAKSHG
jgi:hypothetical protein